jgi:hypothetical protein
MLMLNTTQWMRMASLDLLDGVFAFPLDVQGRTAQGLSTTEVTSHSLPPRWFESREALPFPSSLVQNSELAAPVGGPTAQRRHVPVLALRRVTVTVTQSQPAFGTARGSHSGAACATAGGRAAPGGLAGRVRDASSALQFRGLFPVARACATGQRS